MAVIGATELQPVNILGSYVQGLEMGRANRLAQAEQQRLARQGELEEMRFAEESATRQATRRNAELEAQLKGHQMIADFASAAVDEPSYQAVLGRLQELGVDTAKLPPNFDPQFVAQQRRLALTEAQRIDAALRGRELGVRERTVGVQEKQAQTAANQEARLARQPASVQTDETKVVARTETAADGTVRFYNKFGDLLKTEKGAGKPSATFEKTKATREQTQRDLSGALSTLKEVVKPGGLIEQSTGSLVGKGADILARTVGVANEGDIALGKLQVLADQILKLVPRFEGPQSDKDTQSYREAAGQLADGTLPRKVRKAAAQTLIDLYTKRQGQFTIQGAEADTGGDWQDL